MQLKWKIQSINKFQFSFQTHVFWSNLPFFHNSCHIKGYFFSMAQQPLVGQGFLIIEASRSHSDTPHLVGLFWTNDKHDAETSTSTHNTHKRQTSMPPAGFKPTIPASERPQTHALDRAATGISDCCVGTCY